MADKLTTFAWRHSKRDQVIILALTLSSFPLIWIMLELPKMIINDAIDGEDFPRDVLGLELEQVQYLLALCGAYLAAVGVNNAMKFLLNLRRGVTGERMLRRMRYDLFRRVMSRPLSRLKTTSPGETVQMISAELSPIGDFIGAIFATPIMQGGSFLVYLGFIMVQNPLIGAAALMLYPVQAWLIPKLQAKVVEGIRARLHNIRAMAREINESIDGAVEIRALRTRRWHMAVISRRLYDNFVIRRRIFVLKFLIKFVNNVANHVTPFFIFLIGGYFVIQGRLDLGALTAVLIAYKDLASPWKQLLRYYQDFSDMNARYQDLQDQFRDDVITDGQPDTAPVGPDALALQGAHIDGFAHPVTCAAPRGGITAVYAANDAQRMALLQGLAGLDDLVEGTWSAAQPKLYRAVAMATIDGRVFTGSFRSNLLRGLQFRPVTDANDPEAPLRRREAALTGAPPDDTEGDWIDPVDAGYRDMAEVEDRMLDLVDKLGLDDDLYVIGLGSRADPARHPDLAATLLTLRRKIAASEELGEMREDFIDVWRRDRFNPNGLISENLFFARPADPALGWADFAADPAIYALIKSAGLRDTLVDIGADLCETLISLFEGVAGDSDLLREYGLFPKSEIPAIEAMLRKARRRGAARLNRREAQRMIAIAFDYCPARYRLSVVRARQREAALVAARPKMLAALAGDDRFAAFDDSRYVAPFSISENLFFGPVKLERRDSWRPFKARIDALAQETGLREQVLRLGLDQPVGDGGATLNAVQRRKLALGRGLMKNPGALVIDGIADTGADKDRALRAMLFDELRGGALVYGVQLPAAAAGADHVIWIGDHGGGVQQGSPESFTP